MDTLEHAALILASTTFETIQKTWRDIFTYLNTFSTTTLLIGHFYDRILTVQDFKAYYEPILRDNSFKMAHERTINWVTSIDVAFPLLRSNVREHDKLDNIESPNNRLKLQKHEEEYQPLGASVYVTSYHLYIHLDTVCAHNLCPVVPPHSHPTTVPSYEREVNKGGTGRRSLRPRVRREEGLSSRQ